MSEDPRSDMNVPRYSFFARQGRAGKPLDSKGENTT